MPPKGSGKKLTGALIEAAKQEARVANKRLAIWDSGDGGVKGFGVRITPQGSARYVLRYRHRGHVGSQRELSLGEFPTKTLTIARIDAQAARAAAQAGEDPARDRAALRKAETVGTAFPRWLESLEGRVKAGTLVEYRRQWTNDIAPALTSSPVADITEADVQRIHSAMSDRKVMANRVLSRLSTFFRWCERAGLRPRHSNPTEFVERYPESEKERYLLEDELKRLQRSLAKAESVGLVPAPQLATKKGGKAKARKSRAAEMRARRAAEKGITVDELPPPRSYTLRNGRPARGTQSEPRDSHPRKANPRAVDALRFLLFTGWREQEALTLRWDALDFGRGLASLEDTKTGASARPVSDAALDIVKRQPRVIGNPYVFPGAKPGSSLKEIRHVWYAVRHDAGLDAVRLHDLRHSYASVLASGGESLQMIGKALGHKDTKSTARYAKLFPGEVRKAQDRAAARILAAAERETPVISLAARRR